MAQIQDQPASLPFEILEIHVPDESPTFDDIIALVKEKVRQVNKDAMMLAWYNRLTGQGFPDYQCDHQRPFWELFAESRGYNFKVVVNGGDYVFYYLKL